MLRLSKDKVYSMICNAMQTSEVLDFVKTTEEKEPDRIRELIEVNFDCREATYNEEDPLNLKEPENKSSQIKSSQIFIVYINYNNGSEQSLFRYPTLEHALVVGRAFLSEKGTVKIYESDDSIVWGGLRLVEHLKFNRD